MNKDTRPARPALLFFLLCCGLLAFSQAGSASGARLPLADWRWSLADDPSFAEPGFDDSSWEAFTAPASLPTGRTDAVFWLRTRLSPSDIASLLSRSSAPGNGLWFLSGKAGVAFEIWVDGAYLGKRGSPDPSAYALRQTHAAAFHIPSPLLEGSEGLTIALRAGFRGSEAGIPVYALGDEEAAAFDLGPLNFWNGALYLMLAALTFFLGLYFLALSAASLDRGKEGRRGTRAVSRQDLQFALSLLFIALYFFEIGADGGPVESTWFRAITRASLPLSMAFLLRFFSSFFGWFDRPLLHRGVLGVALAYALAFLLVQGDERLVAMVFNLALLPVFAIIIFGVLAALGAARAGMVDAWPVLAGIFIGLFLAGHDIFYQLSGKEPFAWLQGVAFFSLNASVFVAHSMRQGRQAREIEALARSSEEGAAELASSLERLRAAGEAAAELGRELEAAVGAAAAAVEGTAGEAARIERSAGGQLEAARDAEAHVGEFLESIARVSSRLGEQAESVERTAAAAAELSAGAGTVAGSIGSTARFAAGLAELTATGERAAESLGKAMERVEASSRGISEIVDAVNDFAERTSLLAMNAAIEASHAGQMGRGFAVIANEVKKLSQAQAERASRIRGIVTQIDAAVGEGGRDAAEVVAALRSIAAGARDAAQRIDEASAGTAEQDRASREISMSMELLSHAVSGIRDEATRQEGLSGDVRESLSAMRDAASRARDEAVSIARESSTMVETVRRLRGLAERSRLGAEGLAAARQGAREGSRRA
jgi:methyl-accepting chemotaxis protein